MAKIRFGYSDDFTAKNSKVGINTTDSQANLDVVGVVKGQDLKVTGISSQTGYEGFLRADHQIEENTQLNFGQGINASLSGEIIVGTGVTVTVSKVDDKFANANDGTVWSAGASNAGWEDYDGKGAIFDGSFTTRGGDSSTHDSSYDTLLSGVSVNVSKTIRFYWNGVGPGQRVIRINGTTEINGGSGTLTPGWDSYYNFKGTINTLEVKSANTGSYAMSAVEIDGHILVDGFSTLVDEGARAGGSQVECMKVYNTFTPPSGDTNQRPSKPKPGQLYYNYDFKTIEFHDGYGWRQVDNTTTSGRAIFSGGATPADVSVIDYYNIHTTGNAMGFGDATLTESRKSGCSSATRGLSAGSDDASNHEVIDYVTIASEGNAIDFGDMYNGRGTAAGMSSSTRGVWGGGRSPVTSQDTIDYVEIATKGDALDFGDITVARQWLTGCSSSTRGIIAGGENNPFFPSPGRSSRIEFITMASKGDAVLFGDLTAVTGNPGGCSNSTRGFFGGGEPQTYSKIDMITIASTGNAIHFGDLTVGRLAVNGAGSQTRATFIGGYTNEGKNTIDYITMSTGGDAQDFGDLTVGRWSGASFSDSHGGLGGF